MNIQGSSMLERRPGPQSQSGAHWVGVILWCVAGLGIAAFLANTYVYFNQKISEADREILRVRARIAAVEREIDSYRLQYERYSAWPHIRDAIRRFNLPLRPATPAQCRKLAMIPPSLAPSIAITFKDARTQQPTASLNARPQARPSAAPANRTQRRSPATRYSRSQPRI